jgi:apolipoprotein N-acyltransferase
MVVFRSVENRVPFVRSANTGISGFIDPHGRILQKGPLFQEAVLSREIHPGKYRTFYSRRGDAFGWGCVIMACAVIAAGRFTRGRT